MNTRLLTGSALATLMIAPIAGIATWQILQTRDNSPVMVTEPLAKKDVGALQSSEGQGAARLGDDKNASPKTSAAEQVMPAKPAATADGRADVGFAAKAKN